MGAPNQQWVDDAYPSLRLPTLMPLVLLLRSVRGWLRHLVIDIGGSIAVASAAVAVAVVAIVGDAIPGEGLVASIADTLHASINFRALKIVMPSLGVQAPAYNAWSSALDDGKLSPRRGTVGHS